MSDTPNSKELSSEGLASPAEFDARLKRTDENRWLAARYAPDAGRERLVAVYLLNQELQRALQAKEPMLAKIRIQWWRETLEGIAQENVRRHDLALELARVTRDRADLVTAMQELVDRYDDIADDHMHAGEHEAGGAHEARHYAVEAQLARLAGLALRAGLSGEELGALAACGEAHLARLAQTDDAEARWSAASKAARKLKSDLWPAVAHLAGMQSEKPLAKRWRMLGAVFGRRL